MNDPECVRRKSGLSPIKLVGVAYQKEKVNKHFCAVECLLTNGGDFTFEIVRNV